LVIDTGYQVDSANATILIQSEKVTSPCRFPPKIGLIASKATTSAAPPRICGDSVLSDYEIPRTPSAGSVLILVSISVDDSLFLVDYSCYDGRDEGDED
jgi:hypothetical protein